MQAALALVGLDGFGHRGIGAISGGQKQRVALARTLVTEPRIVLWTNRLVRWMPIFATACVMSCAPFASD